MMRRARHPRSAVAARPLALAAAAGREHVVELVAERVVEHVELALGCDRVARGGGCPACNFVAEATVPPGGTRRGSSLEAPLVERTPRSHHDSCLPLHAFCCKWGSGVDTGTCGGPHRTRNPFVVPACHS